MKKRLSTLICVMLFLCQNSLYVTAEAASAILTENKKTTKEQETSSENDEEQDVLWIRQFIKESILSLERIMHMKRI